MRDISSPSDRLMCAPFRPTSANHVNDTLGRHKPMTIRVTLVNVNAACFDDAPGHIGHWSHWSHGCH